MNKVCYNCGIPLTKENATVEHVPAKNLYEEYPDEYKINRITVPACFDCNQKYAKIDAELRDALAVKNNSVTDRLGITRKGVRSIMRKANWKERVYTNDQGDITAVDFSYDDLRTFHIKNFKALFFRKYGFIVPQEFEIQILADGDENKSEMATIFYDYMVHNKSFEISGHEDIFKFIISDMTRRNGGQAIYESGDIKQLFLIVGLLVYHDEMGAIIFACKKDYLETVAERFFKKH